MKSLKQILLFSLALVLNCFALADKKPVKVFILAGQSNMEGKVQNPLFDHQATDKKTKALFAHLREDDQWIERDDVFIKFLKRHGPLTVGYGSPGRTGIELEFGTVMGEHFKAPVLLIKAAWADARARMTDVGRLGDLIDRAATTMLHIDLERVSPLAVPVLILIGREQVAQQAAEDALLMEAEALVAEAMRAD